MLLLTAFIASGCSSKKTQQEGSAEGTDIPESITAGGKPFISAIAEGWRNQTINVNSTDPEPDVMTLIKAFNSAWPTEVVDSLIVEVGDRRFVSTEDSTVDGAGRSHIFVDCDDFNCASYDHGDTGSQSMDARTYRRENGHMLFAIRLEQINPEQKLFCCFYDYDPKTQVLTPEKEPYANLQRKWKDSSLEYFLGDYYDQTIVVLETSPKGDDSIFHHFVFDGMKHYYQSSGDKAYDDMEEDEEDWTVTLPNTAIRKDEKAEWELYINLDVAATEDHPNQWSVWVANKQTGGVRCLFQTNNDASPKWEEMKDGDAIGVGLEEIAAGDCDVALLVPGEPYKVYVEGCPDGRNVWSYLYDMGTGHIVQFPASEGLVELDWRNDRIVLSAYRYYPEGGRYSVKKEFTLGGKFVREEKIENEE